MTLSNSIANDTTLSFLCSLGNITAITDCEDVTVDGHLFSRNQKLALETKARWQDSHRAFVRFGEFKNS